MTPAGARTRPTIGRLQRRLAVLAVALGALLVACVVLGVVLAAPQPVPYPATPGRVLAEARGGAGVVTLLPGTSGTIELHGRCIGDGEVRILAEGIGSAAFPCGRAAPGRGGQAAIVVRAGEPTTPTRLAFVPVGAIRWAAVVTDVGSR